MMALDSSDDNGKRGTSNGPQHDVDSVVGTCMSCLTMAKVLLDTWRPGVCFCL